jgi:hypothetical protein
MRDWHISDELSLLDHRYILFQVKEVQVERKITFYTPREHPLQQRNKEPKGHGGGTSSELKTYKAAPDL